MSQSLETSETSVGNEQWWGRHELPVDQWCLWQISSLSLFVRRTQHELLFAWSRADDPLDSTLRVETPSNSTPNPELTEQSRFVFSNTSGRFSLNLNLADRSIVARPESSLCIPAGEEAVLFVSSAIWLQPAMDGKVLFELPVYRPSDTWFGANTREGELCYLSRTKARTADTKAINYPHRAVTEIKVINESENNLTIDRLRVPVKKLCLYTNEEGSLVTDLITATLNEAGEEAALTIHNIDTTPENANLLAASREPTESNLIEDTFAKLFD